MISIRSKKKSAAKDFGHTRQAFQNNIIPSIHRLKMKWIKSEQVMKKSKNK
jgi:hypothetical protein